MRKLKFLCAALFVGVFAVALCGGGTGKAAAATDEYYLGGMTAGFSLSAGGAEIVGFSEIEDESGRHRPAEEAGLKIGDTICALNGIQIKKIGDLGAALEVCGGRSVVLLVKRSGETAEATVTPVKDKKSGKYKLGVLIRDTLSGIGTVTYIRKGDLRFGALGHAVCDDDKTNLEIAEKSVYLCSVIGVNKGKRGRAGELRGLFMNDKTIASAETVCDVGLYGTFSAGYDFSACECVEAASVKEATIGSAYIYSTIDGVTPQKYEIAIAKVDADQADHKNFVVKVTDKRLIEETGGIVQGMSGSPIVQNGKLIGAITHVFINDPTRGYGIAIENMLGN